MRVATRMRKSDRSTALWRANVRLFRLGLVLRRWPHAAATSLAWRAPANELGVRGRSHCLDEALIAESRKALDKSQDVLLPSRAARKGTSLLRRSCGKHPPDIGARRARVVCHNGDFLQVRKQQSLGTAVGARDTDLRIGQPHVEHAHGIEPCSAWAFRRRMWGRHSSSSATGTTTNPRASATQAARSLVPESPAAFAIGSKDPRHFIAFRFAR